MRSTRPRSGEGLRAAASAIVARDGEDGIDVLVLERAASSRFLPGYVAFPGGATEPQDAELARRWFGAADEALRACAVRELIEEVGLALTGDGLGAGDAIRLVDADPPSRDQLVEIARWVAPPVVPVRFDARYFALGAPGDLEPRADGIEAVDAWWVSPRRLLMEGVAGTRRMFWPTFFTVSQLAPCRSVDELLELRISTREPHDHEVERLPRSTFWQD